MDIQATIEKLHTALGGNAHVSLGKNEDGTWQAIGGRYVSRPQNDPDTAILQLAEAISETAQGLADKAVSVADNAKTLVADISASVTVDVLVLKQ